jgi:class 3 adenylate cyclase
MKCFEDILNDLLPSTVTSTSEHTSPSTVRGVDSTVSGGGDASQGASYVGNLQTNLFLLDSDRQTDNYYNAILRGKPLPLYERFAIVLQLDICSFTEFAQQLSALELARTLHQIFSRFDSTVRSLNLFKMDTVGDAYIAAAWLTPHQDHSIPRLKDSDLAHFCVKEKTEYMSAQKASQSILWLAGVMLDTLDTYRSKAGLQVSARIGIGIGKVVVGSLGCMQPRIHIRGYAMRMAEQLENLGAPGMVHVCSSFLKLVSGARIEAIPEVTFLPRRGRMGGEGEGEEGEEGGDSKDPTIYSEPNNASGRESQVRERHRRNKSDKESTSRVRVACESGESGERNRMISADLPGWSVVESNISQLADAHVGDVSSSLPTTFLLARPSTRQPCT